jgi:DNA polymerase III subunit delta'
MVLSAIVGQPAARALLERALGSGRLAHAYLFDGPEGVGKRTTAIALGAAIVCKRKPGIGCGVCDDCNRTFSGNHPDVRLFAPDGPQIKIDDAQEMVSLGGQRPHEAPGRVLILDEAHRLNASAANCLLKTLEEPHSGNHFVLVSSAPDRLLPTIRSRTQRIRFGPIPPGPLAALVEARAAEKGLGAASAQAAVAISGGSIGRALDALAAESTEVSGETAASLMASLRKAASSRAAIPMLDAAAQFSGTKEDRARLSEVLTRLSHYYRDVMVTAAGAEELIVLRAQSDEIAALAATTGGSSLPVTKALNALFEAQSALDGNVSPALLTEVLLFRLAALESRVPRSV